MGFEMSKSQEFLYTLSIGLLFTDMISRFKVQLSEVDEPVGDHENAGCCQQRVVDGRKHVAVTIEGLVGEQLSVAYSTTISQGSRIRDQG